MTAIVTINGREFTRRPDDTCPKCGGHKVWQALMKQQHNGTTYIDGCASCLVLWERESRALPAAEPCSNCAWLTGSKEIESGDIYGIVASCIDGPGVFYCHKRVPFKPGAGFAHQINAAGTRVTNATVCAGWIAAKLREKRADRRDAERGVELCESDLTCTACHGSGREPDSADPYFGTRLVGCGDCQGTGKVLPPDDMSGVARTLDDIEDEADMERVAG